MTENSPNLGRYLDNQVHEAHRSPNKFNPKRSSLYKYRSYNTLFKIKDKERILTAWRKKRLVIYMGIPMRLSAHFSAEPYMPGENGMIHSICWERKFQPRILYVAKLSFRNEGEIKEFPEKQKLKEFVTTRPALQEMMKGVLWAEMKGH